MAITIADANAYFNTYVLHKDEWTDADDATKQVALNNAEAMIYRVYRNYDKTTKPVPDSAVFEQALWLLRQDESVRGGELGVQQIAIKGISVLLNGKPSYIAPEVVKILGRRVGRAYQ